MQRTQSRVVLAVALVFFVFAAAARAAYVPIPLTPNSFNHDLVVEAAAVDDPTTHYAGAVSASMDGGAAKTGNTWYEQGKNAAALTTGLPHPGSVVSLADATASFLLQPYTGNHALLLDSAATTGTLTAVAPGRYTALSLLTSSGNGSGTLTLSLQFDDLGPAITVPGTVPSPDWFNASPIAINSNGRVVATTGVFANVNGNNPRLYQENVTLPAEAAGRDLRAVNIAWTGSGANTHTAIFALSGTPVPEPGALCLLGLAATALLGRRRR